MIELRNRTRDTVLASRVEEARGLFSRLRGLLGKDALAPGEGLLLAPCNSVHSFFMRFPIDVLFLDARGRAVRAVACLDPWRATRIHRAAACAIELPAGTLSRTGSREGDLFDLLPADAPPPLATGLTLPPVIC